MVGIVDQYGQPIQRDVLAAPQTSKVAALYREFASHPSRGLTPARLSRILEAAEQGDMRAQHDLFLDMEEKDAHIQAEMGKRKRAILTIDWDIIPPRNASASERKLAGYAKELIQDIPNFEDVILDTLDAIGHGFSCQEIEWEMLGREWLPKEVTHRPQSWFKTDTETRTQIRLRDNSLDGQALTQFGWVTHIHRAKSGYIARAGLHRVLAWPYLFKNYGVGDLAEFLEIYGLPMRLGTYQAGASDDEKATLLRAVMSIGHDAAGIIPEGMAIEFKDAAKGASDPYEAMISWCERSQSKAILGGTLTSQADGKSSTNALGNVHNEVRHDLMVSDAIQLGGTLTRDLVYPLLALNKGGIEDRRRIPKFKFNVREVEDLATMAAALPKLVGVGMRIKTEWAHEHAGIPLAENGDAILTVPDPAMAFPPELRSKGAKLPNALKVALASLKSTGNEGEEFPDQDLLDAVIDASPGEEIDAAMRALLKPVIDNLLQGDSIETAMVSLADTYPQMDTGALEQLLARAIFVADLWGQLNAD